MGGGGAGFPDGIHNTPFPYENTKGILYKAEVTNCADIPGAPIAQAGAGKTWGKGQNRRAFF